MTMFVAAMTDELAKYPLDLVASSLREWSSKEKFWPSLAEILAPIKREMGWRLSLETAAGAIVKTDSPGDRSTWNSMSEDRRNRINEALRRAGVEEPME